MLIILVMERDVLLKALKFSFNKRKMAENLVSKSAF